ncbi:hypothetical protein PT281_01630 [Lactobacillus sp. ESL0701]|uniref:hypothetical protein n=1 Tax=Lactobacillus sp. ESL0701 TaxID=2983217 RepID=UPI0023F86929|nr:hypothetical protein [Lactobacillus sp. ESL0701]MDF7671987.1 hypothetical protein [Lactobacillus sp. ESL0701]
MISFRQLFGELFKSKSKKLLQVIAIQLVAAVILAGVMTFKAIAMPGNPYLNMIRSFLLNLARVVAWTGLIAVLGSLFATISDVEKINHSQTWRLVPTTENTIYLSNITSSLVSFVILVLLEFICGIGPMLLHYSISGQWSMVMDFFNDMAKIGWFKWCQIVVVLFLITLAVYLTVSFLNFSSQTIVDFLPNFSGKLGLKATRFIIFLLVYWLSVGAANIVLPILKLPFQLMFLGAAKLQLLGGIAALVIFNLFVGAIDLFLINKTFEAKANK